MVAAAPGKIPVTLPVGSTVATYAALVLQVPPAVMSVNGSVPPTQTTDSPMMADGAGFTVMGWVTAQPPAV